MQAGQGENKSTLSTGERHYSNNKNYSWEL